jgi:DNA-binding CsgD family transcriptional regulator
MTKITPAGMSYDRALAIAMGTAYTPPALSVAQTAWREDARACVQDGVAEGLSDAQIAARYKTSPSAVGRMREALGKSKRSLAPGSPESVGLAEEVGRLVRGGATDATIAEKLGVSRSMVKYRRLNLGLQPNGPDGQPLPTAAARNADKRAKSARVIELHGQGWRDREIGLAIGLTERQIANYRAALGLAAHPR